jgi:hypothetical protein
VAHDVTVLIEDADVGNRRVRHVFLTTASRNRLSGVKAEGVL